VRLSNSLSPVDEERVVALAGVFCYRQRRGMSQLRCRPNDEVLEGAVRVETRRGREPAGEVCQLVHHLAANRAAAARALRKDVSTWSAAPRDLSPLTERSQEYEARLDAQDLARRIGEDSTELVLDPGPAEVVLRREHERVRLSERARRVTEPRVEDMGLHAFTKLVVETLR
jgi:hypothetical protein